MVVEQGEHRFFDFASIGSAADQNDVSSKIQSNAGRRFGAVPLWVCLKFWHMNYTNLGAKGFQFCGEWLYEHRFGKQRVPCAYGPNVDT